MLAPDTPVKVLRCEGKHTQPQLLPIDPVVVHTLVYRVPQAMDERFAIRGPNR